MIRGDGSRPDGVQYRGIQGSQESRVAPAHVQRGETGTEQNQQRVSGQYGVPYSQPPGS